MRILYIEDHEPTAYILHDRCKGVTMECAPSLAAARRWLAVESFDVLLVDLNLPDSSGMDTVRALADYDLPMVVLTGDDSVEFRGEAWRLGVADYIHKDHLFDTDIEERLLAAHASYERIKRRYSSLSFAGLDLIKPYITAHPFASISRSNAHPV